MELRVKQTKEAQSTGNPNRTAIQTPDPNSSVRSESGTSEGAARRQQQQEQRRGSSPGPRPADSLQHGVLAPAFQSDETQRAPRTESMSDGKRGDEGQQWGGGGADGSAREAAAAGQPRPRGPRDVAGRGKHLCSKKQRSSENRRGPKGEQGQGEGEGGRGTGGRDSRAPEVVQHRCGEMPELGFGWMPATPLIRLSPQTERMNQRTNERMND